MTVTPAFMQEDTMAHVWNDFTGEPDAVKVASPVRMGAVGNLHHSCQYCRETKRELARRWPPTIRAPFYCVI
jgi:hypothetical protein